MIFVEKKEKEQWIMTASEAKLFGQKLIYLAEEANDHQRDYMSQVVAEGNPKCPIVKEFRIIAKPDKKDKNHE